MTGCTAANVVSWSSVQTRAAQQNDEQRDPCVVCHLLAVKSAISDTFFLFTVLRLVPEICLCIFAALAPLNGKQSPARGRSARRAG